jgi:P pilus assembly chaperone PapD
MTTKRLVLAASMMAFIAMFGQAHAGTTISDTRYWPSEVSSADQITVQRAENAFDSIALDSARMSRGIEATRQSYQGGPKGNY